MKKGFTLIELLAVIVILAIIALIATPIILGIINNAKEESDKRSTELYVKAAELAVARKNLEGEFKPTTCEVTGGECDCNGTKLNVEMDNASNINGTITFNEKGVVTSNTLEVLKGGTTEDPTPVGEQYLYQWYIGENISGPTVGNSINLSDYPETNGFSYSTTAPDGKTWYNKLKIEDNIVTEGYSCTMYNEEEYCVRGGDKDENNFYGDDTTLNKGYLKSIDGTNEISCTHDSLSINCFLNPVGLEAYSYGTVAVGGWAGFCKVFGEGSTICER